MAKRSNLGIASGFIDLDKTRPEQYYTGEPEPVVPEPEQPTKPSLYNRLDTDMRSNPTKYAKIFGGLAIGLAGANSWQGQLGQAGMSIAEQTQEGLDKVKQSRMTELYQKAYVNKAPLSGEENVELTELQKNDPELFKAIRDDFDSKRIQGIYEESAKVNLEAAKMGFEQDALIISPDGSSLAWGQPGARDLYIKQKASAMKRFETLAEREDKMFELNYKSMQYQYRYNTEILPAQRQEEIKKEEDKLFTNLAMTAYEEAYSATEKSYNAMLEDLGGMLVKNKKYGTTTHVKSAAEYAEATGEALSDVIGREARASAINMVKQYEILKTLNENPRLEMPDLLTMKFPRTLAAVKLWGTEDQKEKYQTGEGLSGLEESTGSSGALKTTERTGTDFNPADFDLEK